MDLGLNLSLKERRRGRTRFGKKTGEPKEDPSSHREVDFSLGCLNVNKQVHTCLFPLRELFGVLFLFQFKKSLESIF